MKRFWGMALVASAMMWIAVGCGGDASTDAPDENATAGEEATNPPSLGEGSSDPGALEDEGTGDLNIDESSGEGSTANGEGKSGPDNGSASGPAFPENPDSGDTTESKPAPFPGDENTEEN